jgi:endonuclease/exonuclease/phosphatase family metal-dependent hydrolase
MMRIVVQRARSRAILKARLSRICLAAFMSCTTGCAHRVHPAPDFRSRPCTHVVDAGGTPLEPSRVSWTSPDDPDERSRLDAWCETVGPVVVQETATAGPPLTDRIVFIGWNVHLGAGDVARLVGDLRSGRLGEDATGPPVILLLQEAFRSGDQLPATLPPGAPVPDRIAPIGPAPRRNILEVGQALGLNVYYLPTMRNGRGDVPAEREDRGLAILSSTPLDNLHAIELPLERQRRVALTARLRAYSSADDVVDVRVVGVHFENRSGARRLWLGAPHARRRQAEALVESLGAVGPTVIEGDLNTWANREPALEVLGRDFEPCTQDDRPTFPGGLRLDHILSRLPVDWAMSCRRLDDNYGSDHYPLVAIVRMDGKRDRGANAPPPQE